MSSAKLIIKIVFIFIIYSGMSIAQDETIITPDEPDTQFVMQKSPWGAVLRSMAIPGWGQLYNESYIKAVIVWGLGGWLAYNWVINNNEYNYYNDLFRLQGNEIYRRYRTFYRDQRDLFTIYLSLTYLLNLVDAYVDAHLFDFTVEEDFLTRTPQLNIRIRLF
jgi:hypothetical protein